MISAASSPSGNEPMMGMGGLAGGDSLDDIIMQNDKEIQRRQSLPRGYSNQVVDRRSSMLEFGSSDSDLNGFQFGIPSTVQTEGHLRRQSTGEIEIGGFPEMSSGMDMSGQQIGFPSSMQGPNSLSIDTNNGFQGMSPDMVQGMMGYGPMTMEGISEEDSALSMFSTPNFSQPYGGSSLGALPSDFMMTANVPESMQSHTGNVTRGDDNSNTMAGVPRIDVPGGTLLSSPRKMNMVQNMGPYASPTSSNILPSMSQCDSSSVPGSNPPISAPTPIVEPQVKLEKKGSYQGIYSSSGFDMLGALMKVATRKNPEIDIGKVDMSCAFVVCDVTQNDCPIIYVSEIFERLTGYTKHEVLGQNCRFLQSPEGKVQAGMRREFVDNDSVYYLKKQISNKREAQQSLINYRKGGQPFMNLLTMIPITGEDGTEDIKYFVGFQVDLVEKPTSVEGKNASGLYTVDYSQGTLPRYIWQPPEGLRGQMNGGQTISRDDVSTVLSSINNHTESELTKRMWDKVLLENTDDVVHVLSLKGLFLYLSPSCRNVLEYDSSELVGTALSSVCHPSDIVPVTRELKDTSTGASVNIVFRIRRKKSGYTWFESHGSLCVEQGKGRKCIILVGRERPVYALARHDIQTAGGIGESEMWTKLSTSGMFLFVSANIRMLLDRSPDELVGTSIQAIMRPESKVEFGRSLEKARTGKIVTHKHEIINKRGLYLQAQTTLYPGDAQEGQKPTFLVAQTRLLKTSSKPSLQTSGSHGSNKSMNSIQHNSENSTPASHPSALSSSQLGLDMQTPNSTASLPGPITQAGGAGLAIGTQDDALASEDNIFDELKTTRCTSWQFELRQMEKSNRLLAEELAVLLSNKKKRKRRKGAGPLQRDCANCHTRQTPEWRRGPSGQRDLCNSCGLRWAKQVSRSNSDSRSTVRQTAKGWSQSDSSTSRS
ncbi:PAS domain-containing protein [Halenospora varia]|nr:PAS domain-containing protein [Halenospora varia]